MLTFNVSSKPPRVPQEHARIYRLAPPRVNQKTVLALAHQFGLKGSMKTGSLCQDARLMSYSEGSLKLIVHYESGGLRFRDEGRWQVDDGTSHVEFDDAEAVAMAERFIKRYSVVPLGEYKLLRVTHLNVGMAERRSGLAENRIIDVGVAFTRIVEGIPVEGPGGKAIVYIDAKGSLTGIDRLWREVLEVHAESVPLRPPDAVQKEAEREWGQEGSGLVTIDDVRFGYFEQGWDVSQRYLQPAYVLSMTLSDTEGDYVGRVVMRSSYWGPAAEKSPERLLLRPRSPQPQAPRKDNRDSANR